MDEFRGELSSSEPIYATLAYDSATVDAENSKDSNLFVFNMQLLNGNVQSQIVQISQNSTGCTDDSLKSIVYSIIEEGSEHNIHFLFVSTDGETGTNKTHTDFFNFLESFNTIDSDKLADELRNYSSFIPVSDWYHILKDIRGRYRRNKISMFPGALIFNAKQLNEIFKLDKLVIEAKGQSAVINDLAIYFFNSENLRKLAQNDEFCSLAYTLVTITIQSLNLSPIRDMN